MVYDTAKRLAAELQQSAEYQSYRTLRDTVTENATTKSLLDEYHRLQLQAQAAAVQGTPNDELLQKLQKLGEVLQFDKDAAEFLIAEYRMNRMLADVYKILAEAIDIDLGALEA